METAAYSAYMLAENDYDMFLSNFGNLFEAERATVFPPIPPKPCYCMGLRRYCAILKNTHLC
jgi:hypothetical protein